MKKKKSKSTNKQTAERGREARKRGSSEKARTFFDGGWGFTY